jgi:hypothetical protein
MLQDFQGPGTGLLCWVHQVVCWSLDRTSPASIQAVAGLVDLHGQCQYQAYYRSNPAGCAACAHGTRRERPAELRTGSVAAMPAECACPSSDDLGIVYTSALTSVCVRRLRDLVHEVDQLPADSGNASPLPQVRRRPQRV